MAVPKILPKPGGLKIADKPKFPPLRQAKGLEKLVLVLKDFVITAQFAVIKTLFGKFELQGDQSKSKIQKALDKGVLYIISKIAGVDFCNIISSGLNSVKIGKAFDPLNPPPSSASDFEKKKWQVQYKAFRVQTVIDDFNSVFGVDIGQDIRVGIKELIINVNQNLSELNAQETGIASKEITNAFPETSIMLNAVNEQIGKLSSYLNINNISQSDVQNVLKIINDVRTVAVAIQSLNNPANLISTVDSLTGGNLNDEINKIQEFVNSRGEVLKLVKYLLEKAKSLNSTARSILGYINLARTMIKLFLLLIRVFYTIRFWITGAPVPLQFVDMGTMQKADDLKTLVIDYKGIQNFINRLQQFEALLREIGTLAEILILGANEIIQKLTLVKLNLESCNSKIAQEIDETIQETSKNSKELEKFLSDIQNAVKKADTTFGEYTIFIVTEELADEGIRLKRRYGIARDSNNYIVAQSTPTFASLDQIIINEVKALLVSKGLVKPSISALSPENAVIYENALTFLGDDAAEFNANTLVDVGIEDNDDIQEFVDNLPGGIAFRIKSRKRMIANNEKLLKNLKNSDPNLKYTKSIFRSTQKNTNNLKIKKLQDEKKLLQLSIIAAASNPVTALGIPLILQKIKKIDEEIEILKRS